LALFVGCNGGPRPRGSGQFEIYLGSEENKSGYTEVPVPNVEDRIFRAPRPEFTEADVKSAKVFEKVHRRAGTAWWIGIEFRSDAAKRLEKLTRENARERLVIVLRGEPIAAPIIMGPMSNLLLQGEFTREQAAAIAAAAGGAGTGM